MALKHFLLTLLFGSLAAVATAQQYPYTLAAHVIVDSCSGCGGSSSTVGQTTMSASAPVVIASDQSAIDVHCTVGCTGGTPGQTTMAASSPVVIASDQSAVAVSGPITDAQLRATAVPVSGPVTDTQLRASAVPVSLASVPSHAVTNAGTFAVQVTSAPSTAVTNAGTFAVQAAATLAAETTKVIGTINIAGSQSIAVTQATGTNLHAVLDAGAAVIGALTANQSVNLAQVAGVTTSTSLGVADTGTQRVALTQEATYAASTTAKTATASGTAAFFELCGSGTKTIRLQRIMVSGTWATAGTGDIQIRKNSSAGTGGTATTLTTTPYDSNSAAATATAKYFTVLPTGGGALVGNIMSESAAFPVAAGAMTPQLIYVWRDTDAEAPTLRGTAQCIAAGFGTAPGVVPTLSVSAAWTEK